MTSYACKNPPDVTDSIAVYSAGMVIVWKDGTIRENLNLVKVTKNSTAASINSCYLREFGRPAEQSGLNYWYNSVATYGLQKTLDNIVYAGRAEITRGGVLRVADYCSYNQPAELCTNPPDVDDDIATYSQSQVIIWNDGTVRQKMNLVKTTKNSDAAAIQATYINEFGRPAEQEGFNYWYDSIATYGLQKTLDNIVYAGQPELDRGGVYAILDYCDYESDAVKPPSITYTRGDFYACSPASLQDILTFYGLGRTGCLSQLRGTKIERYISESELSVEEVPAAGPLCLSYFCKTRPFIGTLAAPQITRAVVTPASLSVSAGQLASWTVSASVSWPDTTNVIASGLTPVEKISYQWQHKVGNSWQNISGQTGKTFQFITENSAPPTSSGGGTITGVSITRSGSGLSSDVYAEDYGSGSGADFDISVTNGKVSQVSITNGGSGYIVGDDFGVSGLGFGPATTGSFTVTRVTQGTVYVPTTDQNGNMYRCVVTADNRVSGNGFTGGAKISAPSNASTLYINIPVCAAPTVSSWAPSSNSYATIAPGNNNTIYPRLRMNSWPGCNSGGTIKATIYRTTASGANKTAMFTKTYGQLTAVPQTSSDFSYTYDYDEIYSVGGQDEVHYFAEFEISAPNSTSNYTDLVVTDKWIVSTDTYTNYGNPVFSSLSTEPSFSVLCNPTSNMKVAVQIVAELENGMVRWQEQSAGSGIFVLQRAILTASIDRRITYADDSKTAWTNVKNVTVDSTPDLDQFVSGILLDVPPGTNKIVKKWQYKITVTADSRARNIAGDVLSYPGGGITTQTEYVDLSGPASTSCETNCEYQPYAVDMEVPTNIKSLDTQEFTIRCTAYDVSLGPSGMLSALLGIIQQVRIGETDVKASNECWDPEHTYEISPAAAFSPSSGTINITQGDGKDTIKFKLRNQPHSTDPVQATVKIKDSGGALVGRAIMNISNDDQQIDVTLGDFSSVAINSVPSRPISVPSGADYGNPATITGKAYNVNMGDASSVTYQHYSQVAGPLGEPGGLLADRFSYMFTGSDALYSRILNLSGIEFGQIANQPDSQGYRYVDITMEHTIVATFTYPSALNQTPTKTEHTAKTVQRFARTEQIEGSFSGVNIAYSPASAIVEIPDNNNATVNVTGTALKVNMGTATDVSYRHERTGTLMDDKASNSTKAKTWGVYTSYEQFINNAPTTRDQDGFRSLKKTGTHKIIATFTYSDDSTSTTTHSSSFSTVFKGDQQKIPATFTGVSISGGGSKAAGENISVTGSASGFSKNDSSVVFDHSRAGGPYLQSASENNTDSSHTFTVYSDKNQVLFGGSRVGNQVQLVKSGTHTIAMKASSPDNNITKSGNWQTMHYTGLPSMISPNISDIRTNGPTNVRRVTATTGPTSGYVPWAHPNWKNMTGPTYSYSLSNVTTFQNKASVNITSITQSTGRVTIEAISNSPDTIMGDINCTVTDKFGQTISSTASFRISISPGGNTNLL